MCGNRSEGENDATRPKPAKGRLNRTAHVRERERERERERRPNLRKKVQTLAAGVLLLPRGGEESTRTQTRVSLSRRTRACFLFGERDVPKEKQLSVIDSSARVSSLSEESCSLKKDRDGPSLFSRIACGFVSHSLVLQSGASSGDDHLPSSWTPTRLASFSLLCVTSRPSAAAASRPSSSCRCRASPRARTACSRRAASQRRGIDVCV